MALREHLRHQRRGLPERVDGAARIADSPTRGYQTKRGVPFNPRAVLTILRNRSYLGETAFRGKRYPAPHEPLIDEALFERAKQILHERGENPSLRRSNQSYYLLTGLMRCARCGKRYIGAAAHGNGGRYPYYVCFTRQRYGTQRCDAERLPAQRLDDAILECLEALLAQEQIVRDAIQKAFAELDQGSPRREAELKRLDTEIRKANTALERYLRAFEAGTMPEHACSQRIQQLTERVTGLQARRQELAIDDVEAPEPLSDEDLSALQAHVRDVIATGDPPTRKALLQALVAEIRVVSATRSTPPSSFCPAVRPPHHHADQYRYRDSNPHVTAGVPPANRPLRGGRAGGARQSCAPVPPTPRATRAPRRGARGSCRCARGPHRHRWA